MVAPATPVIAEGICAWAALGVVKPPLTTVHVVPLGDLREHLIGEPCWCHPERGDYGDLDDAVVHKALDNREAYEEGLLQLH